MKTFLFFKVIAIFLFLSSIDTSVFPQDPNYPIYHNMLIVGDTCILRQDPGYCSLDKMVGLLVPDNLYWPDYCPDCMPDTIFSFKTELVPGTDSAFYFYFILPLGTLSGSYDMVHLCDGYRMHDRLNRILVYTSPVIWIQPRDTIICAGDNATFSVTAYGNKNEDLTYDWYHNDSLIISTIESELIVESAWASDTGSYYCVISNQYGTDTTQTVVLDLHPFPVHPGLPTGPDRFCGYVDSTVYTILSDPLATGYNWQLLPEQSGVLEQSDTSCIIFWDKTFSGVARLDVELLSGNCGRNTSDTLHITVPGISVAPEICIVGIDEVTGKYRIVWEKSAFGAAQLFRIYRESNQADVYLEIGTVDTSQISFFVDSTSLPDVLSHRYKISYLDSCGLESEISQYHQTMHLVANLGLNGEVNLSWSEYGGIAFPTYTIYRGNHPDSMGLFIQVPSTVTSYKDINPPLGKVYYQIGMSNPAGCDPVTKSESNFSSSLSNMDQVLVTGVNDLYENKPFRIFPNPATDVLHVRYEKSVYRSIKFTVYNSLGEAVLDDYISRNDTDVDVRSLSQGIYIIQTIQDSKTYSARFVVKRK